MLHTTVLSVTHLLTFATDTVFKQDAYYNELHYTSWCVCLEFSQHFFENSQMSSVMKICPVGADLFHVDGQMDRWTDGRTGKHDEANRSLKKVQIDNINCSI